MNTLNHSLWGATIGRTVGLPLEGAVFGGFPDLLGVSPLVYYKLRNKIDVKAKNFPKPLMKWYYFTHNWFLALGLILILVIFSPHIWILGLSYFWHVFEDAFLHGDMAVPFLFPFWRGKVQIISAADNKWIQVLDLLVLIVINILISIYKIRFG